MLWANISFPVPVSPVIRIAELVQPYFFAFSMAFRMAWLLPVILLKVYWEVNLFRVISRRMVSSAICMEAVSCKTVTWPRGCPSTIIGKELETNFVAPDLPKELYFGTGFFPFCETRKSGNNSVKFFPMTVSDFNPIIFSAAGLKVVILKF